MKKLHKSIIFLLCLICFSGAISVPQMAWASECENRAITLKYNDIEFTFIETDLKDSSRKDLGLSNIELLIRVYNLGVGVSGTIDYVYPKFSGKINEISKSINIEAVDAKIDVTSGVAKLNESKTGLIIDTPRLYKELFIKLLQSKDNIIIEIPTTVIEPVTKSSDLKRLTNEKSSFVTYINGVNQEGRINNIMVALEKFNGFELLPHQSVSFNKMIGDTTEENGYKLAKIILNGEYADGLGGGVCQAATTLYNASIVAGLKILRVRPHSLKVGYVKGSFDAMVSAGISDLVIENPYDTPVYFYTYATKNECGVKVFGAENEYTIDRRMERVEFDENEFPSVSYKSCGYLDYYNKAGELVKSEKIRQDTYYKLKPAEPIKSD